MNVIAIIQARLASTRLPRKVLAPICGKPMVQHVLERAGAIAGVDRVVLAVPASELHEWSRLDRACTGRYLFSYGGPAEDVLGRFAHAARANAADVIVRLTADCPLICPEVCAAVLDILLSDGVEYATNDTRWTGWPDGLDCQAFTRHMLERADVNATSAHDREHVCAWMEGRENPQPLCYIRDRQGWAGPKLSVDSAEDLERVRRIMARIPAGDYSWEALRGAVNAELPAVV